MELDDPAPAPPVWQELTVVIPHRESDCRWVGGKRAVAMSGLRRRQGNLSLDDIVRRQHTGLAGALHSPGHPPKEVQKRKSSAN